MARTSGRGTRKAAQSGSASTFEAGRVDRFSALADQGFDIAIRGPRHEDAEASSLGAGDEAVREYGHRRFPLGGGTPGCCRAAEASGGTAQQPRHRLRRAANCIFALLPRHHTPAGPLVACRFDSRPACTDSAWQCRRTHQFHMRGARDSGDHRRTGNFSAHSTCENTESFVSQWDTATLGPSQVCSC